MEHDCIFCKIVKGEIPSSRVYEDSDVLAFLDIAHIRSGHTLVILKRHVEDIFAVDAEGAAALGRVIPKIACAVREATGAGGVNILQASGRCAGQVVPHIHFHIIPRSDGDGIKIFPAQGAYAEGEMERARAAIAAAIEKLESA